MCHFSIVASSVSSFEIHCSLLTRQFNTVIVRLTSTGQLTTFSLPRVLWTVWSTVKEHCTYISTTLIVIEFHFQYVTKFTAQLLILILYTRDNTVLHDTFKRENLRANFVGFGLSAKVSPQSFGSKASFVGSGAEESNMCNAIARCNNVLCTQLYTSTFS